MDKSEYVQMKKDLTIYSLTLKEIIKQIKTKNNEKEALTMKSLIKQS